MLKTVYYQLLGAVLLAAALTSCPAPFQAEQLKLLQDTESPGITIISPADYSEYSTVINLKCTISDEIINSSTTENTITVSYEIPGTTLSGTLSKESDESFSAAINTSTLDGSHTIKITATDGNGNVSTKTINIVKPAGGGDISGFSVTPGNKQAAITWDTVPFAASYTIYEYNYGQTKTGVTSPYVWTGLNNGAVYSFRVMADIPSDTGEDAYSATVKALPLSTRSFAPRIKSTGYKSVTLEWWNDTNVSSEYRVERSLSQNGPWEVRRSLTLNTFTDTQVDHNTEYWYRVYPADYPDIVSSPISAVPARFIPLDEAETVATPNYYMPTNSLYHPQASFVSGSYAYIVNDHNDLAIFDISDPDNPVLKENVSTPESVLGIYVSGNYAYLADGTGLVVVDVSNKSNPSIEGTYNTTGTAHNVFISGNYAYVADGTNGLVVVNVSNPANPVGAGSKNNIGGDAKGIAVSGSYAYIADGSNGLVILDISNLTLIQLESNSPYTDYDKGTAGVNAYDVCLSGNYAYLADSDEGLVKIYISDPANPSFPHSNMGTMATGTPKRLDIKNNFAYVAGGNTGIHVFNINSTGSILPEIGTISYTNPQANDVVVSGNHAFIADGASGLVTADVATPDHLEILSSAASTYHSGGVAVAGDYAYIVDKDTSTFSVVSIADPSMPIKVGTVNQVESVTGIRVRVTGNYAYVANDNYGMRIYDISSPSHPAEVACTHVSSSIIESINDIALSGSYAYAADGTNGLVVFNIADPENPVKISTVAVSDSPKGIAVSGSYAFLVLANGTLTIYNISDPENPSDVTPATGMDFTGAPTAIAVDDSYAYITTSNGGLYIYDISNPSAASQKGYKALSKDAEDISVHGKYAYIAAVFQSKGYLLVMNVSDPANPSMFAYSPLNAMPPSLGVAVAGNYAFMAVDDFNTGLSVVRLWEDM